MLIIFSSFFDFRFTIYSYGLKYQRFVNNEYSIFQTKRLLNCARTQQVCMRNTHCSVNPMNKHYFDLTFQVHLSKNQNHSNKNSFLVQFARRKSEELLCCWVTNLLRINSILYIGIEMFFFRSNLWFYK